MMGHSYTLLIMGIRICARCGEMEYPNSEYICPMSGSEYT